MEVNREILTKAFHLWNNQYLKKEKDYAEIDGTIECAEQQADELISIIESL